MAVTDSIADMLTRIRNAHMARHDTVLVPSSKMKVSLAKILKQEGFIKDYDVTRTKPQRNIKIVLRYEEGNRPMISGLERASKPGLRLYVGRNEIPRVYGGLGITIVSTSKGLMTGHHAWKLGIGGELLCYVW
jgi:small subunit ribosomal protein S8